MRPAGSEVIAGWHRTLVGCQCRVSLVASQNTKDKVLIFRAIFPLTRRRGATTIPCDVTSARFLVGVRPLLGHSISAILSMELQMSFLVFCTFDLKNASSQSYQAAYNDLAAIGLRKVQKADNGNDVVIPTTAVMGTFAGANASAVRDDIRNKVQAVFRSRGLQSEIFLVVGGDWAWGSAVT